MNLEKLIQRYPSIPYIAPFAIFMGLLTIGDYIPGGVLWSYPVRTVLVAIAIVVLAKWMKPEGDLAPAMSIGMGILVLVLWILPEGMFSWLVIGETTVFNPHEEFTRQQAFVWIGFRLAGTAIIVPIVEEFFWRGFLIRWLVKPNFEKVKMGTFTWYSFLATSGLFALEHNRWAVGLMAGVFYNLLYIKTGSLKACIVAHAVTNLGLGIYVLVTGEWVFL
jgi:CAAX prenyl protease-like protein